MNDLPDLDALLPPEGDDAFLSARHRLKGAIRYEVSTRRRLSFMARATAMGLVIFSVWSIAPSSPSDDQLPLLGLAAATARLSVDYVETQDLWYTKAEVLERVDIANGVQDEFTVLKRSVHEEWTGPGSDRGYRRTTVADLTFLSTEDWVRFSEAETDLGFRKGEVSVDEFDPSERWVDPMWSGGAAAVETRLRLMVEPTGDTRLDRVSMLDAATELMRQNGRDPARQSLLLYVISDFPGIEVTRSDGVVTVSYKYVLDGVAREMLLDFDAATGLLVSEKVSTMPYGEHPGVLLAHTEYDWNTPDQSVLPPVIERPVPENRSTDFGQERP